MGKIIKGKLPLWIFICALSFLGGLVVFNHSQVLNYFYSRTVGKYGVYDHSTYFWLDPQASYVEGTTVHQILSGTVYNVEAKDDSFVLTVKEDVDSDEISVPLETRIFLRKCGDDCEEVESQMIDHEQIEIGDYVQIIIDRFYDKEMQEFGSDLYELRIDRYLL